MDTKPASRSLFKRGWASFLADGTLLRLFDPQFPSIPLNSLTEKSSVANQYSQSHLLSDDLEHALSVTAANVKAGIDGEIDLLFAFAAGYSPEDFDRHLPKLKSLTGAKVVLGCTAETAAGGCYELENAAALSLWAAKIPSAEILPMHLTYSRSSTESAIVGWPEETDGQWPDDSSLIVIGEPFGFPVDVLLERFNEDRPGVRIAGGMASGASAPGCLLYTSPSPRDATLSRMPSSA